MTQSNEAASDRPAAILSNRRRLRDVVLIVVAVGASLAGAVILDGAIEAWRGGWLSRTGPGVPPPGALAVARDDQSPADSRLVALMTRVGFSPLSRQLAPALALRDALGAATSLEPFRGKVVLVAFWGTTCIPCMEELPELERLADRFRRTDLVVLPVCVDEADPRKAHEIAASRVSHLPVYIDAGGTARQRYNVFGLPHAVLVDREGRVLARSLGAKRWMRTDVEELLCGVLGDPFPIGPDADGAAR